MGTTGQQDTKEIHTHCTVCPKSKEERTQWSRYVGEVLTK